jgi:D-lactate dehydrogenase
LLQQSDIISLHCPLNEQTQHIINSQTIKMMKKGVMLINTSRGGLVNANDVIEALKAGQIGYLGMDVYEQEENIFFRDLSSDIIADDTIQRLMSFPNVLITAHQAFFTEEALTQISLTTLRNINALAQSQAINKLALLV